ncbi:MAG: hypothetical protein HC799_13900 [Limnothrix sp. RL_2_0]|nr:hypothetical protein [Limnothrix sp. RL_2_0]
MRLDKWRSPLEIKQVNFQVNFHLARVTPPKDAAVLFHVQTKIPITIIDAFSFPTT